MLRHPAPDLLLDFSRTWGILLSAYAGNFVNGQIAKEQIADTTGSGHGALAGFLSGLKADVLICGGIGGCAGHGERCGE